MKSKPVIILTLANLIFLVSAISIYLFTFKMTSEQKALLRDYKETNKNVKEIMKNTCVPVMMVNIETNICTLEELDKNNIDEGKRLLIQSLSSFYRKFNDKDKAENPELVNRLINLIEAKSKEYKSFERVMKNDCKPTN